MRKAARPPIRYTTTTSAVISHNTRELRFLPTLVLPAICPNLLCGVPHHSLSSRLNNLVINAACIYYPHLWLHWNMIFLSP